MVINRRKEAQETLSAKQVAKLILLINATSPEYKEELKPKFKMQETAVQQILGMPLSDEDRKLIVRELNLLGWEVAINCRYWLVFTADDTHLWHEAGTKMQMAVQVDFSDASAFSSFSIQSRTNSLPNDVAKFQEYTDDEVRDELIQYAYGRASESTIEKFEDTDDESYLGIEEGAQLPICHFTYWEYLDYFLAKKGLNRKAPLVV